MAEVVLDESDLFLNLTSSICGYTEECGAARFILITAASCLAILGAGSNLILTYIFTCRTFASTPPTLYPIFLAILDTLICAFYVLFFGVDVFAIFLRIETLFIIYHTYILPLFVLSKIIQLSIPFVLIFVTLERYAWIANNKKISSFCLFTSKFGRIITICLCFGICVLLRLPTAMALTIEEFPECDFFRSLAVSYKPWAKQSQWFQWYDFNLVSLGQILVPFIILVLLNSIIVIRLSAIDRLNKNCQLEIRMTQDDGGSFRALKRALRRPITSVAVKNAVYTTVAIVSTYLICSGLHLILTALERVDSELLKSENDPTKASSFYTILGDTISFGYMFTSAIRILIYCKCNPAIKLSIQRTFCSRKSKEFHKLNIPIVMTTSSEHNENSHSSIQI